MNSAANPEMLADIVREMRYYFQTQKRNGNPEHRPWHQVLSDWADRIEAAAREMSKKLDKNHDIPGAAAAMREALEEQLRYWDSHIRTRDEEQMRKRTEAALAAPPRNCDVGTAEEQGDRFARFCDGYNYCSQCPIKARWNFDNGHKPSCGVIWGQMPYEAEGSAE